MNHLANINLIVGTWKVYDLCHDPLQTVLSFLWLSAFLHGLNALAYSLDVKSGLRLMVGGISYAFLNYVLYVENLGKATALMYFCLIRYFLAVCLTSSLVDDFCRYLVSQRTKEKADEIAFLVVLMDAIFSYFEYNLKGGPLYFCFVFIF